MKRILDLFVHPHPVRPGYTLAACSVAKPRGPMPAYFHSFGLLVNWRAFWLGAHYSVKDRRLCVNLVPCVTVWWARPGGYRP